MSEDDSSANFDSEGFDSNGWHRLHSAALYGDLAQVNSQLDEGVDINLCTRNNLGRTCLHGAAAQQHVDVLKLLVERKANINALDRYGRAPLHRCKASIAEFLLDYKANVNQVD